MIKKEVYAIPQTEVLELHLEGSVLDASGQANVNPYSFTGDDTEGSGI